MSAPPRVAVVDRTLSWRLTMLTARKYLVVSEELTTDLELSRHSMMEYRCSRNEAAASLSNSCPSQRCRYTLCSTCQRQAAHGLVWQQRSKLIRPGEAEARENQSHHQAQMRLSLEFSRTRGPKLEQGEEPESSHCLLRGRDWI